MENVTKNQHVVPQTYLKKFLASNDKKLECLNIEEMRLEKKHSPESICKEFFYYAMEPGKEDEYSQIVEKGFGDLETWYGDNIDRIENSLLAKQKLSDDDKYGISWIIANFYFRGYKFRQQMQEIFNQLADWIISNHIYEESSVREQIKNTSHITNRAFDSGFPNTLTHKKWQILINKSPDNPFITGDEPIIEIYNDKIPKNQLSQSLLLLTHIFNLSPKISIIASCSFNESEHGQIVFEDVSENRIKIIEQNLLYIKHTHKYCYSSSDRFFLELISSIKNP